MGKPVLAICALTLLATPVWPCEIVGGSSTHQTLIRGAKVVVRARAEAPVDRPGRQGAFPAATQVRFRVLAIYKGKLDSDVIQFNGSLLPADVPGDRPKPFDLNRPRSATASCYATDYRQGVEYLLVLGNDDGIFGQIGDLTPYWAPQAPTNERLTGNDDPWLLWVIAAIKNL